MFLTIFEPLYSQNYKILQIEGNWTTGLKISYILKIFWNFLQILLKNLQEFGLPQIRAEPKK